MILMTERRPLECSLGVGAAANDPSPRKSVWSSHFANWAASRMVKGRTRTVTEMDDAPSAAMVVLWVNVLLCVSTAPLLQWRSGEGGGGGEREAVVRIDSGSGWACVWNW